MRDPLSIQGEAVCRGSARGYQAHWPFDEVDIASWCSGHNWVSVEAYQPGCSTFQYLHENYAGLLVASSDPVLSEALRSHPRSCADFELSLCPTGQVIVDALRAGSCGAPFPEAR